MNDDKNNGRFYKGKLFEPWRPGQPVMQLTEDQEWLAAKVDYTLERIMLEAKYNDSGQN